MELWSLTDILTIHGISRVLARDYASDLIEALPEFTFSQARWASLSPGGYISDVLNFDGDLRAAVALRVSRYIRFKRPRLIVAHSLGSVALFDALQLIGVRCSSILTIGSPLARDLYYSSRAVVPDCKLNWKNIYAAADPVPYSLFYDAPPDLLSSIAEYKQAGVEDIMIDGGGFFESHSSYWTHPAVHQTIREMLE